MYAVLSRLVPSLAGLAAAAGMLLAPSAGQAQDYEIWALDQGTHIVHIYSSDLEEVATLDLGAEGVRVPHMIDFSSDGAYAFIASTGSGDVTVIDTAAREIVTRLDTGPRTHAATVRPGDGIILAAVIGSPDNHRDGKVVEIVNNGDGSFEIARELVIAEAPAFQDVADRFNDVAAICQDFSADGALAFVSLGPSLADGGVVVVDADELSVVKAFPPDELQVNCGTVSHPDGRHMIVNGGGHGVGVWYVIDTETLDVVHEGSSLGEDAHGVWVTPDGSEIWMVNRGSDNVIVIDPETFEIIHEIEEGVGETPDIIAISPDSRFAFVSLRGPNPISMPHMAVGTTPGFAVVDIAARELVELIQPAEGNEDSDFHGIGVRVITQ